MGWCSSVPLAFIVVVLHGAYQFKKKNPDFIEKKYDPCDLDDRDSSKAEFRVETKGRV